MGTGHQIRDAVAHVLVPIDNEMKHEATKRPGNNMLAGNTEMARLTVESMAPMPLAAAPNALQLQKMLGIHFTGLAPRSPEQIDLF